MQNVVSREQEEQFLVGSTGDKNGLAGCNPSVIAGLTKIADVVRRGSRTTFVLGSSLNVRTPRFGFVLKLLSIGLESQA